MYKREEYLTEINNEPTEEEVKSLVLKIYDQVYRKGLDKPGFSHIKFCYGIESREFRVLTVKFIEQFNEVYFENNNEKLKCITMGRYDQKETTKFHLDGGPEESYLILGYEPSEIKSEISFADYSLAAFNMNISPKEFLLNYNPMFREGEDLLKPYVTDLIYFDETKTNLLFFNNSCGTFDSNQISLGVLHKARITNSFVSKARIINSIQIGRTLELYSNGNLNSFINLDVISRKPYE